MLTKVFIYNMGMSKYKTKSAMKRICAVAEGPITHYYMVEDGYPEVGAAGGRHDPMTIWVAPGT